MRQQMNFRKQYVSDTQKRSWNTPIYSCSKSDVIIADLYAFMGTLDEADSISGRLCGS